MNWTDARRFLPATVKLSLPLIVGQLGQMVMILIDMYMLGWLGPQAIGGAGVGGTLYWVFTMFGAGTLYGLDYLVGHDFGASHSEGCRYWLHQSFYVVLLMSLPGTGIMLWLSQHLDVLHLPPDIAIPAGQFLGTLCLSLPPFLVFIAMRQYLQATDRARPGTVVTVLAVVSNIIGNRLLIFGVPGWIVARGVAGVGMATSVTRILMALALVLYVWRHDQALPFGRPDWSGIKRLLHLGVPSGSVMALEVGVFALATSIVSQTGVVAAASHTIVMNLSGFTYMVPIGISGATAVLVGQERGRRNAAGARIVGWTSIALGAAIMFVSGVVLVLAAQPILSLFTADPAVLALGHKLLLLVAIYQVADGVQAVAAGALRGLGETHSAMLANLVGYWGVGLPVGWWLCTRTPLGAVGFWMGLTVGLYVVGGLLLYRWWRGPAPAP